MPYQANTDYQIYAFGNDLMTLFNSSSGVQLVTATRDSSNLWTIHAEGAEDAIAATREDAVNTLADHALTISPETGCSVLVPHGLRDLP